MQDIPVLATGVNVVNNIPRTFEVDPSGKNIIQNNLNGNTNFTTITLEVDPKQAQDLVYLISTQPGNLFMVLRNPNDRAQVRYPSSNMETVSGVSGVFNAGNTGVAPITNYNIENSLNVKDGKVVPSR